MFTTKGMGDCATPGQRMPTKLVRMQLKQLKQFIQIMILLLILRKIKHEKRS